MRVYLDVSCLNRPFDDQWQERIRIEAESIALILARCGRGQWQHVSSGMALIEVAANPDSEKQKNVRTLLPPAADIIELSEAIYDRADVIAGLGIRMADAVHVAAAEAQRADVLLTCDDRFVRAANRSRDQLHVQVLNPVTFLQERQDATGDT